MNQEVIEKGVTVPPEVVKASDEYKRQHRTVRQSMVYRDMANMKFLVVKMMANAPRRYAKYFDEMLVAVSNAKQSLALGLTAKDIPSRQENMDYARVLVEDIADDAVILHQLGVISKTEKKGIGRLAQKITGQTVRLRDYFESQGMNTNNGKTF